MAKYVADMLAIASIYPGELEPIRRSYGPSRDSTGPKAVRSTLFRLDPVPRGKKPFVLEVYDSFEDILNPMQQEGSGRGRMQKPVPVQNIVDDLLGRWTGSMYNVPAEARPGIIQIVGTVPTSGEVRQMEEQQSAYFEYWFAQGEALYRGDPTTIENYKTYSKEMRLAANWLDRSRPWSDARIASESEPCKWCTTIIPKLAIFCPQCQKQVRDIPEGMSKLSMPPKAAA